ELAKAIGGEGFGAIEDLHHVAVARDHPGVEALAPVHRFVITQPGVERERVLNVAPRLEVEVRPRVDLPHRRIVARTALDPQRSKRALPRVPAIWRGEVVRARSAADFTVRSRPRSPTAAASCSPIASISSRARAARPVSLKRPRLSSRFHRPPVLS